MRRDGPYVYPIPLWRSGLPLVAKAWLLVPVPLRAALYNLLVGPLRKRVAPETRMSGRVQKLPFGLYLKSGRFVRSAEPHALLLVERNTNIPIPKLLDWIIQKTSDGDFAFLVTTEAPGKMFQEVHDQLSDDQIETIGTDLGRYINALHQIPNPYPQALCGASGEDLDCPYWHDDYGLPSFVDMAAFHAHLREVCGTTLPRIESRLQRMFQRYEHTKTVFTHGDINTHNILVHNGKLSAIIDWETAGWMPVYWEYFAAVNGKWDEGIPAFRSLQKVLAIAIPEDYETERENIMAVNMLWRMGRLPEWADAPEAGV